MLNVAATLHCSLTYNQLSKKWIFSVKSVSVVRRRQEKFTSICQAGHSCGNSNSSPARIAINCTHVLSVHSVSLWLLDMLSGGRNDSTHNFTGYAKCFKELESCYSYISFLLWHSYVFRS